jgi:hypothetical protein
MVLCPIILVERRERRVVHPAKAKRGVDLASEVGDMLGVGSLFRWGRDWPELLAPILEIDEVARPRAGVENLLDNAGVAHKFFAHRPNRYARQRSKASGAASSAG